MEELRTLVIYDIVSDRIRTRVGEVCKDYGLKRIQFSGFVGSLSRNKREELSIKLRNLLDGQDQGAKILIQPICEKDLRQMTILHIEAQKKEIPEATTSNGNNNESASE